MAGQNPKILVYQLLFLDASHAIQESLGRQTINVIR